MQENPHAHLKALLQIQFRFVKEEINEAIILVEEDESTLNSSRIARMCLVQTFVDKGLLWMELSPLTPSPAQMFILKPQPPM